MNKQIEEMARVMANGRFIEPQRRHILLFIGEAEALYRADYRKQKEGEWVRYPHGSGIYCSLCKHKRRYRDIHDAFCPNCGARMKGERNGTSNSV